MLQVDGSGVAQWQDVHNSGKFNFYHFLFKIDTKIQELLAKQNYETKNKNKNHENTEEMWHRKPLKIIHRTINSISVLNIFYIIVESTLMTIFNDQLIRCILFIRVTFGHLVFCFGKYSLSVRLLTLPERIKKFSNL